MSAPVTPPPDGRALVLRPQPAADRTAERLRAAGLTPLVHPLFALSARTWGAPDGPATAVLVTSANAVRLAGPLPDALARLPAFAVGSASAAAARAAGLSLAFVGEADGAQAVRAMAAAGHRQAVHLRGETARALPVAVTLLPVMTYAADPTREALPDGLAGATALVHSPRAAALFARRLTATATPPAALSLVAISAASAAAAGPGWRRVEVAKRPTDGAMVRAAVLVAAAEP